MAKAQTSQNRRFRTKKCRLGSAGLHIQAGDEIWIPPAPSLQLVVCPFNLQGSWKYHFLSVIYMHGIMNNELSKEQSDLLNKMEPVVLR